MRDILPYSTISHAFFFMLKSFSSAQSMVWTSSSQAGFLLMKKSICALIHNLYPPFERDQIFRKEETLQIYIPLSHNASLLQYSLFLFPCLPYTDPLYLVLTVPRSRIPYLLPLTQLLFPPSHLPLCIFFPSLISPVGTLLHRGDIWHAHAPPLPRSGIDSFLLHFSILLLIGPIHLLLQIPSGAPHAAALEEIACAEFGAESNEGEALAAHLLLEHGVLPLHFFTTISFIYAVTQHRAKQSRNLVNIRLHLWHKPPKPAVWRIMLMIRSPITNKTQVHGQDKKKGSKQKGGKRHKDVITMLNASGGPKFLSMLLLEYEPW